MKYVPTRLDLFRMLPNGSHVAEIGVCKGHFSAELLNLPNIGMLYMVDAWMPIAGYDDPLSDTDHEANYREALANVKGHQRGGRVHVIRGLSKSIADKSIAARVRFLGVPRVPRLDACYIDANHSFESALQDLTLWRHCLKSGGVLMGHDYVDNETSRKHNWGVIRAVEEFCRGCGWKLDYLTTEEYPSYRLIRA